MKAKKKTTKRTPAKGTKTKTKAKAKKITKTMLKKLKGGVIGISPRCASSSSCRVHGRCAFQRCGSFQPVSYPGSRTPSRSPSPSSRGGGSSSGSANRNRSGKGRTVNK